LRVLPPAGRRTGGGFGVLPVEPSFRASRPVLVKAIRLSLPPDGWSTLTLIERKDPSWVLFVGF